jgi:glycosyltransferase involved in cell wall biosynthesis
MTVQRHVVWIQVAGDRGWELPPAIPRNGVGWGHGGRRDLHELAVAIAASGRPTGIRGDVDVDELRVLGEAAGAVPDLPTEPRRLDRGDLVVMEEGGTADSVPFARAGLSAARAIIMLLAPPGLFGWPFVDGWSHPSPATVPISTLAQPEHFRAMAGLGFELWTHQPQLVERAEAAGVACTYIGNGRPMPFPQPLPKRYDVVTLAVNRWAQQAREVVARLDDGVTHHEIPMSTNAEVLEALGQARVFIHPTRVEGDSTLGREARAMGTVPVVLNTSPFAVGLDDAGGAVAVAALADMPAAVMALLRDAPRLRELADRGMRTARIQADWGSYVARVDEALRRPPIDDPTRAARAAFGAEILARETTARAQHRAELLATVERLEAECGRHERERDDAREALQTAEQALRAMTATRAWRLARTFWRVRAGSRRAVAAITKHDGAA